MTVAIRRSCVSRAFLSETASLTAPLLNGPKKSKEDGKRNDEQGAKERAKGIR
jgi:hypothetical protein